MSYRLRADERVQDGLRRCAREQLDRAIDELTGGVGGDPVSAVHDARKALNRAENEVAADIDAARRLDPVMFARLAVMESKGELTATKTSIVVNAAVIPKP